jgi:PAS domain S-box-containing protein
MLPLLMRTFTSDHELSMIMGVMLLGYFVMLLTRAKRTARNVLQNICFRLMSKARQKRLQQSQQRYQTLLKTASDAFFLHDMQGRFIDVNEQACKSLGYTKEELLQLSVFDIEKGVDLAMLLELWPHLQTVSQLKSDCVHRRKDGSTFPVEARLGLVKINNEELVSVFVRDVTQRKESERLVRQSQQRMALHVRNTPLGVIECDQNGMVTEWNATAERIFGFIRDEVMGKDVAALIIPDYALSFVQKTWSKVCDDKDSVSSTNDNITKSGAVITCEWYNTPLIDEDGEIFGIASLVQDITEQLNAKQLITESEASYRALFELSDEAMMTMSGKGLIDCNKATMRLFGLSSKEEFIAKHPADLSPPMQPNGEEAFTFANELIATAYRQGKNSFEWVHKRVNGESFPAEVLLTPMILHGENVVQAIVRDITLRKQFESNLITAKMDAEVSDKAKSEFLSRMSHEFRTPLNAIMGFAQILELGKEPLSKRQLNHVHEILGASEHLLTLTNSLLDMADIESGKMAVKMDTVSVSALLQRSLNEFAHLGGQMTIEDNVSDLGILVMADEVRLRQVLVNLLSNNIKRNNAQGSIVINGKQTDDNRYSIGFTDTGVEISQSDLNNMFTPFEELTTTNNIEQSGIGLTISKYMIEMMDGKIGVSNKVGVGYTFWIELALGHDDPACTEKSKTLF